MKYLLVILFCLGCSTASKMNELFVGMTREQVVDKLGKPDTKTVTDTQEYLIYDDYCVGMLQDKVNKFGQCSNFSKSTIDTHLLIHR